MATKTSQGLTVTRIEDHEGDGHCGSCGREGLRWVVRLSDGSGVGVECVKAVLDFKPAPKSYQWVSDYTPVLTVVNPYGESVTLYAHKRNDNAAAVAVNGRLVATGPRQFCADTFQQRKS